MSEHFQVVIVGAGFSGLGTAARLKEAGIEDFVVLERGDDVGGTWRDNTYPGCACDVPSHLYSLSFAANPGWSRTFSPQGEIQEYLRGVADERQLREKIRFGAELQRATWDDRGQRWLLQTSQGALSADMLVSAAGGLSEPSMPDIPGLDSFEGKVFHSARWDHDHDLAGRRVAVIGTGASAIQFVPQIQPEVGELSVFQRTAPWIMPGRDRKIRRWEQVLYRRAPWTQKLVRGAIYWGRESYAVLFMHPRLMGLAERISRGHLRRQVKDPELRRKLTPDYRMGCKRILPSNGYYPALAQDNARLVTDSISEVRSGAIVTADGTEHLVDTIILGTGFHVTDSPALERIRGRAGRSLAELWKGSPTAHLGTTVAGFPNLFMLLGPGTGLGHNSVVFMVECQIRYLLDCLRVMRERGAGVVEVRPVAQRASSADADERLGRSVWATGGCQSWYQDASGRLSTLWPGTTWRFRRRLTHFDPSEYLLHTAHPIAWRHRRAYPAGELALGLSVNEEIDEARHQVAAQ